MYLWRNAAMVAVLVMCFVRQMSAEDDKVHRTQRKVPNRYIALLYDDTPHNVTEVISELAERHGSKIVYVYRSVLKGAVLDMSETQARALSRDPRIEGVWEDAIGEATGSVTPRSWNLDRIDDNMIPRLDSNYSYCYSGKKTIAYVVDSGIWAGHDEFSNPDTLTGGARVRLGKDVVADAYYSANLSNNPPCERADDSPALHGTKVASILGGRTLGAAPDVTLVPVRVTNCNDVGVSSTYATRGLDWIQSDPNYLQRPDLTVSVGRVVVMSLIFGSGFSSTAVGQHPVERSLRNLVGMGITVVVAAGNSNQDAAVNHFVPSRDGALIVVGGSQGRLSTDIDARWYDPSLQRGSNYGPTIDLFAPARNVMVAHWSSTTATSDPNNEMQSTGTSFAAPLAAGAVARYLEFYPNDTHAQMESRLVANATSDAHSLDLQNRLNSPNRLLYIGYGCRQHACCGF